MTDHSAVVQGLAAGVGGAVLTLLGVDAQTLTAALIGCVFGVSFAPAVNRWRAVLLFFAAVSASAIAASVLGPPVSALLPSITPAIAGKGVALAVGVLLHPIIQAASLAAPALIRSAAERLGGGKA
ncbi:MAG: hypothetical protein QE285_14715 [Aquabacterium sp.]|nr:hypothetical protein [Aquabacterium sp.]